MPSLQDKPLECLPNNMGSLILPKCKLSYPHVWEPVLPPGETNESKKKYQCALLFPPGCNFDPLVKWITATVVDKWGPKVTGLKNPILDHAVADKGRNPDLVRDLPHLIRTSSKYQPTVLFPNGVTCSDREQVYPGRWARVSVGLYAWSHPTGGKGISVGLSNIVLLEDDEVLGGGKRRAEDEFADYFTHDEGNGGVSADSVFS